MEKTPVIFVLAITIAISYSQSSENFTESGDKYLYNVSLTETDDIDEVQNLTSQNVKLLYLFKCHGSNIDVDKLHKIPDDYIMLPESQNYTTFANFTEKDPGCPADLVATSSQLANEKYNHTLYTHGWLLKEYDDTNMPSESIPTPEFCIQSLDENEFTVKYCKTDCTKRPCVSKCCLANEVCDVDPTSAACNSCVDSGPIKWTTVANGFHQNTSYSYLHYSIDCDGPDSFNIYSLHKHSIDLTAKISSEFKILQNGSVASRRKFDGAWVTFAEGTYCVDGAVQSTNSDDIHFSGHPENMVLYSCRTISSAPTELEKDKEVIRDVLYRVLIPFATVFLIITIIVYLLSWSKQNVHGYTAFFYLVTLLALYIFLIISNTPGLAHPEKHPKTCAFIAGAIHFFYLSTMCWLTSLSFNVWRTFNKNNMLKRNNSITTSRGLRRFSTYCVFSIGYPTIQVGFCVVLDAIYRNTPANEVPVVLPNYGLLACNNLSNDGITYYLFTPVSVLLGCNSIFFIATIITMKHYKKSIREAFREVNNSNTKVDISFGVYARMFIIMGIFWMTQIITWFIVVDKAPSKSLQIIIAVTDALTVLQAVVIFYIFVCKRHVFTNLWNLQPWLHPFLSLWIKGGCCATPIPDARKPSQTSTLGLGRRGFSKKESTISNENRISKDSNMFNPNAVLDEDMERKTSVTSDMTVVSDVDAACSGRPESSDCDQDRRNKKTSETTF